MNSITVKNCGHIFCRSIFYYAQDCLQENVDYNFSVGINKLVGEIDSGIWAISYLLSMYSHRPKDFVLFSSATVSVDNNTLSITELNKSSCYMDKLFPLFNSKHTVATIVKNGLKKNNLNYSSDYIRNTFVIDRERFNRPLFGIGNEIFNAMAAIAYCYKKDIYCFPWMSGNRFANYHNYLPELFSILSELRKIVVFPIGEC